MSQLSYPLDELAVADPSAAPVLQWVDPPPRSTWQPVLLVLPVILAVSGYLFGSPIPVDLSFLCLTILCIIFLVGELGHFVERFGVGGLVLFGGVLIWFCYDYFTNWFLAWVHHWDRPFTESVVAKSAMCHMIYILSMTIGLRIRAGRWLSRLITRLPEPPNPSNYFAVVIITQIVGLMPYVVFTHGPFYLAIYHQITGGRNGTMGTEWTVGRTGNVNYNFGAYVAQILQVGEGGAVVASFCAVFLRQNLFKNIVCWAVWLLWLGLGFGTGTRGEIVVLLLPVICFIFIRYHVQAQELLQKYSARAYVFVGLFLIVALIMIQVQIRYRNMGFSTISLSDVSLTKIEGNAMFSEGLMGFTYIPDRRDYFYDDYPGETIFLPIPNFLFWAAVAPMPRAVWTTKPIDSFWRWYNAIATGRTTVGGGTQEGTTVAEGIVGYWYFRFGYAGIIEGGIFMGWLLGVVERALYNNNGRPMAFLASLALLTWLFRAYRSADLQDLAGVFVFIGGLSIVIIALRPFLASSSRLSGPPLD